MCFISCILIIIIINNKSLSIARASGLDQSACVTNGHKYTEGRGANPAMAALAVYEDKDDDLDFLDDLNDLIDNDDDSEDACFGTRSSLQRFCCKDEF